MFLTKQKTHPKANSNIPHNGRQERGTMLQKTFLSVVTATLVCNTKSIGT